MLSWREAKPAYQSVDAYKSDKLIYTIELSFADELTMRVKQHSHDFLNWLLRGWLLLLPERWLDRLRHVPDMVTVEQQDNSLVFRHYEGSTRQLCEQRSVSLDDEQEKAAVNRWFNQQENAPDLVLLLPQDKQLEKRLSYPLSSEQHLRDVLGFDMDKQTPFTSDQVCFGYIITRKDAASDKLHLNLYVVLREVLQKYLDVLGFLDVRPVAATIRGEGDMPGAVNFIPPGDQKTDDPTGRRLKFLVLVTLGLLLLALYLPLLRHEPIIEQLEIQVEQSRLQAMQTQALIDQKAAILQRRDFLSDQHERHTPVILLFQDLTRRLPDNTWISRLIISDDEIQMHGESGAAAALIQVMEESDYFEQARFRSPITKNNATAKDQFHIAAKVTGGLATR